MPTKVRTTKKTRKAASPSANGQARPAICAEPGCREKATRVKEVVVRRSFCGEHG